MKDKCSNCFFMILVKSDLVKWLYEYWLHSIFFFLMAMYWGNRGPQIDDLNTKHLDLFDDDALHVDSTTCKLAGARWTLFIFIKVFTIFHDFHCYRAIYKLCGTGSFNYCAEVRNVVRSAKKKKIRTHQAKTETTRSVQSVQKIFFNYFQNLFYL